MLYVALCCLSCSPGGAAEGIRLLGARNGTLENALFLENLLRRVLEARPLQKPSIADDHWVSPGILHIMSLTDKEKEILEELFQFHKNFTPLKQKGKYFHVVQGVLTDCAHLHESSWTSFVCMSILDEDLL